MKKNCIHLFKTLVFLYMVLYGPTASSQSNSNPDKGLFRQLTEGRIATDGGLSRGVAWGDYDNDGDPDLYVSNSNGQWNALYRNNGNGQFKKMTANQDKESETVIYGGNSQGVHWVDYDNDGDLDLYVVSRREEANLLFRNDNQDGFTRITDTPLTQEALSASMACWADMDLDGDLDVFLAGYSYPNVLFRNLGEGQFEQVEDTPLTVNQEGRARACGCGDANNDGLPELYVGNARKPNLYFQNLGDWNFQQLEEGHLVEDIGYSYGVSWADYDDDGDLDLFVANFDKQNFLYTNDGQGNFIPVTEDPIATEQGGASKGHSWGDYDNDGDLDLFIANGTYGPNMHNFLFLNQGDGSFTKDSRGEFLMDADTSAGVSHADYDRDGDLDLFVANWGSRDQINRFYENINEGGNWISMRLRGTSSNWYGIGAKVVVKASDGTNSKTLYRWMYPTTGYASQNDYELHFGLGNFIKINSIEIHWPSGQKDTHRNVTINRHWVAEEKNELMETN
ncbi:MAG: CRTAC1 family protein [Bacteroidota bacterium]